jgi:hypothetical protein
MRNVKPCWFPFSQHVDLPLETRGELWWYGMDTPDITHYSEAGISATGGIADAHTFGIHRVKFFGHYQESGVPINSERYVEMPCHRLMVVIWRKHKDQLLKSIVLLQDNACPHTGVHMLKH